MKCELLINAVGCIDGALIDEAENYRPKRRIPAWIWAAASAACLCVVVLFAASFSNRTVCEAELMICIGADAHGYIDYRERAETGKVLITDELASLMNKNEDTRCRKYEFSVRITDANGASRDEISLSCLIPLGINDQERTDFISSGVITLSRKEIFAIKSSPQMALIISPSIVGIGEEYLNTVGHESINVWVALEFDDEFLREYEYMEEYDRLDGETRLELIEGQISRFFETRYSVQVELDEEFKEFLEEYDRLDTETRHDSFVREISRFFYEKYTEQMVNGDSVKNYIETFGDAALDGEFKEFLHKERVFGFFKKYAEDNGIDVDGIKEYTSGTFNAELDVELIKRLLQDERTRSVYATDV